MVRIRVETDRNGILEAIRGAAMRLGRPPHRGELPRVAGISHSVVLKHFASLRDAVRAAGLEPSRRGLKVPAEDLLKDFARVAAELGHAPNRNEYVRHGKYAAGTFYARFGSWPAVAEAYRNTHHGDTEARRTAGEGGRESTRIGQRGADQHSSVPDTKRKDEGAQAGVPVPHKFDPSIGPEIHESDKAIALQWAGAITALPGELAGKRRVTDAVCAMIVNTLMGEEAGVKWQRVMMGLETLHGENCQNCHDCQRLKIENLTADPRQAGTGERGLTRIEAGLTGANGGVAPARLNGNGTATLARVNGSVTSGGVIDDERPVMGPPFYPCALSNAPANEMGVMILFGMLAGELGFQIEAVQGKYPDIEAKRQIQPGRWQRVRIEAEYESRNFALHGHDPEKCDIIVCWRHNWVKCPKEIEVIELSRIVG